MNAHFIAHKRLSGSLLQILLSTLAVLFGCVFPLAAQTFYVSSGNDILSVGPTGAVSTYAIFTANAQAAGLAVDAKGNLFVGDSDYGVIREVTPNGTLSVVAMLPASSAAITGLTFDASGNLYVADGNILEINPAGVVSTFATLPTNAFPQGLAFDSSGNLYAADSNIAQISKITPGGVVSTFASLTANSYPYGLAFDGGGNLYVAGLQTSQINKITSAGMVSTFANLSTNSYPEGLAFDGSGNLYSGDIYTNQISKISPAGSVSTFASNVQNASFLALRPVPEPSTWAVMLLMSGGAIVLYRWRRMQKG